MGLKSDIVNELKRYIIDYEDECNTLEDMVEAWNEYGDPDSDPGLQYEQELRVSNAYDEIKSYVINNM